MRCSNCGNLCSLDDNFCRKCGASLRNVRVPAARNGSQLPVAWRGAMPVVARGAAVFALGAVIQMLLRMVGRRAVQLPAFQPEKMTRITPKGLMLFRRRSS
jgi:hypothetical protein